MRVAEVHGVPLQGAGFFGADPGAERQGDVRADPGTRTGFQQRGGLVEGEGSAGPAGLSGRGVGQFGDVAADQVAGGGEPDSALEREVAHADRGGAVAGRHRLQCRVDGGGVQLAELHRADAREDGFQDVFVLADGLSGPAGHPAGQPVIGCFADGVVDRRRLGGADGGVGTQAL